MVMRIEMMREWEDWLDWLDWIGFLAPTSGEVARRWRGFHVSIQLLQSWYILDFRGIFVTLFCWFYLFFFFFFFKIKTFINSKWFEVMNQGLLNLVIITIKSIKIIICNHVLSFFFFLFFHLKHSLP